jgi:hypothetical protein
MPRVVGAREAEQVPEGERGQAHRGAERQHHCGDEDDRRDDGPQQEAENDEHHGQHDRDDDHQVTMGVPLDVEIDGGAAADLGVSAGDRVHRGAHPVHGRVCRRAVRLAGQGALQVDKLAPDLGRAHRRDPGGGGERRAQPRGGRRVADDGHGLARAGREMAGQDLLAGHRVRGAPVGLGRGQHAEPEADRAGRGQDERGDDPDQAGPAGRSRPQPR